MEITRANIHNLDDIHKIDDQCFAMPWSKGALLATLDSDSSRYYMAVVLGEVVGYIGFYSTGDILNVATLPSHRNKGIATRLINHAINMAKLDNIERLVLEVRESNAVAIKLYSDAGFELVARRQRYYHDQETALIYAKDV